MRQPNRKGNLVGLRILRGFSFPGAGGGNFAPTHAPSCEENAVALETTAFLVVDEGHRSLEAAAEARLVLMA